MDLNAAPKWAELIAPITLAMAALIGAIVGAWASLRRKIEDGVTAAEMRQVDIKVALDGRLTELIEALKAKGALDVKLATMEAHEAASKSRKSTLEGEESKV